MHHSTLAFSLDRDNSCPRCSAYLIIKYALTGINIDHYYIGCGPCRFFHPFPKRDAPPTVRHIPPHPGHIPSAALTAAKKAPTKAIQAGTTEGKCVNQACGRNAPPACPHQRCKTHCIVEKDGCLAVGHQLGCLTARHASKFKASQASTSFPTPAQRCPRPHSSSIPTPAQFRPRSSSPPPLRLPSPSPPRRLSAQMLDILDHASSFTSFAPPTRFTSMERSLILDAEQEEYDDLLQDQELSQYLRSPTFSNDDSPSSQEQEELALAVKLSRASYATEARPQGSSASLSRLASASASSSRLSSASASSPRLALSASPRLIPVYPANKIPSVPTASRPPARPKMTTQMGASWMREYKDNTAADSAAIKRGLYKSALDLSHKKRFYLVFWGQTGQAPMIKLINTVPHWPLWAIGDMKDLLYHLELEDMSALEWYDHGRLKLWIEVSIDHQHELTSECYLFLRRPGVECAQFDTVLQSFITPPVHIRQNLKRDRQGVRAQLNGKGKKRKVSEEVEVVAERYVDVYEIATTDEDEIATTDEDGSPAPPPQSSGRRTVRPRLESNDDDDFPPSIPLPASKRPTLTIDTAAPPPSLSEPASASTSTSDPTSMLSSSSTPPTTPVPSPTDLPSPMLDLRRWPVGLYVDEVVAGMRSMESQELQHLPVADRFKHVYRRAYVQTTYNDALRRWRVLASEDERQSALLLGKMPLGLWTNWQKGFPLRKY
ncbi:hypothetical protein C8R47DRAFT_1082468 [Mycena vitilis]|nr:hypothetical protein C8R47DRAFT_1082468 [Mycena vitilis]